jgi:RNA polymerase sigma factor (sigma-70 family)
MGIKQRSAIFRAIRRIADGSADQYASDKDLLLRFVERRDEAAFTAVVRRYDSMVMGVALRVLRHHQDAEDVCQATFLLLAKKANIADWKDSVASWLYEVAHRLSLKALQSARRRTTHEGKVPPKTAPSALADISAQELQTILDEELSRMPERYRSSLILCCLEGRTRDEAARFLGIPLSTVISRLVEGREMLRRRLTGRGVPLSLALVGVTLLSETARAALPATMARALGQVALQALEGEILTNVVSANVATLTKEGMKIMFLIKVKTVSAGLLVAGLLVGGLLAAGIPTFALSPGGEKKDPPAAKSPSDAKDAEPAGQDRTKVVKADEVVKDGKLLQSLAFCNNGKTLAVVIHKGSRPTVKDQWSSVVLWDVQKGKMEQTLEKFDEGTHHFYSVTASKDGKRIAAAGIECGAMIVGKAAINVWDAQTGNLVQTVTTDRANPYAALSADGKRVACTGNTVSHGVFMWDVDTGKPLKTLEAPGDAGDVGFYSVAFSDDGKLIAAGGNVHEKKKMAIVWEVETGKVKHKFIDPFEGAVRVAFSPDSKTLATGGHDEGDIRVWDLETGMVKRQLNGHGVRELAFSPDGKSLVSAGYTDSKVIVWDIAQEKPRVTLEGHKEHKYGSFLTSIALAPDGRTVASASCWDGTMRVWQLAQPKKK